MILGISNNQFKLLMGVVCDCWGIQQPKERNVDDYENRA